MRERATRKKKVKVQGPHSTLRQIGVLPPSAALQVGTEPALALDSGLGALLHAGDEASEELVYNDNFNSHTQSILILYNYGRALVQRQQWVSECVSLRELDLTFHSYIEGIVRGYRNGLLTQTNYTNLTQCETIDGIPISICMLYVANTIRSQASTRSSIWRLPCISSTQSIYLYTCRKDNRQIDLRVPICKGERCWIAWKVYGLPHLRLYDR